ncbi:putative metal-binding motif-containing protein [Patescibacteria group bacterium]|nr:putative metal-binding motif-containing protein [Patescibacteria group bacterium]MBU1629634.1 putative metal-binding motif-containing protein [Patescibacteria group bacterium]
MYTHKCWLVLFTAFLCGCIFDPQPEPPDKDQDTTSTKPVQIDNDGDGFTKESGDCDDMSNSVYPGAEEFCNGKDDNCDGQEDEGILDGYQYCDTGIPGICAEGVIACQNGSIVCAQVLPPVQETCNGIDDDCDGQADQENPEGNLPCDTGMPGICADGVTDCQNGSPVCMQAIEPVQEVCDGIDNNCNGQSDENLGSTTCGIGACKVTQAICVNGVIQTCKPKSPSYELCNSKDDDCDGQTDENLGSTTCGIGACKVTQANCVNGVPQTCKPKSPSSELCNSKDDDCDGQTDENNPEGNQSCNSGQPGICAGGLTKCLYGSVTCLQAQQPLPETCNGKDDDCDGQTDEENSVGCLYYYYDGDGDGYGTPPAKCLCAPSGGYQIAQGGDCNDTNTQVHPNAPEICDNIADNNCDGYLDPSEIDNDGDGYTECQNDCNDGSKYVAPGLYELCDQIDNNCNNAVDEGCSAVPPVKSMPMSSKGVLRGIFPGGSVGDSGRSHLGVVDSLTGLFIYIYKFYWNLDSGETVKNGSPTIANTAQAIWNSGRLPMLDIRVDAFTSSYPYISQWHIDRLRQFAYWVRDEYTGEIAVALFHEMNLENSPYCSSSWSKAQCIDAFKNAFMFVSNLLSQAAPGRIHVGINYNMRFYGYGGVGAKYADWSVDRGYYDWVGYNIFAHACALGKRETDDIWFLKAALKETNNNFHDQFCANAPCIIAETAASNSCSAGYQNWWIDRFAIGSNAGYPYLNLHLPLIKGVIWFHQNNYPLGGWEENWLIANYAYFAAIFGNSYFVNTP